jgi:hypothetical protein
MRNLQLGVTLVRKANAFEIDLSSPSDHKTAAVFGPSRTTLNAKVSALVDEYTALADLDTASKHYLFYKGDDASEPYSPSAWTTGWPRCGVTRVDSIETHEATRLRTAQGRHSATQPQGSWHG